MAGAAPVFTQGSLTTGKDHPPPLRPVWRLPSTSQVRPREDESGTREGFLKMNNLAEAGPVAIVS